MARGIPHLWVHCLCTQHREARSSLFSELRRDVIRCRRQAATCEILATSTEKKKQFPENSLALTQRAREDLYCITGCEKQQDKALVSLSSWIPTEARLETFPISSYTQTPWKIIKILKEHNFPYLKS